MFFHRNMDLERTVQLNMHSGYFKQNSKQH